MLNNNNIILKLIPSDFLTINSIKNGIFHIQMYGQKKLNKYQNLIKK